MIIELGSSIHFHKLVILKFTGMLQTRISVLYHHYFLKKNIIIKYLPSTHSCKIFSYDGLTKPTFLSMRYCFLHLCFQDMTIKLSTDLQDVLTWYAIFLFLLIKLQVFVKRMFKTIKNNNNKKKESHRLLLMRS